MDFGPANVGLCEQRRLGPRDPPTHNTHPFGECAIDRRYAVIKECAHFSHRGCEFCPQILRAGGVTGRKRFPDRAIEAQEPTDRYSVGRLSQPTLSKSLKLQEIGATRGIRTHGLLITNQR
jgi:hypothetical protein